MQNSEAREYSPVAKLFHWLMAAIIVVAWFVGYYGGAVLHYGVSDAETAQKIWAITLHKSIATTTLFLIVGRLIWRAYHRPPALVDMPDIMKHMTHLGHAALYFLMIAVPVSGWANSSSAGYAIPVAGLFTIPGLGPKNPELTPYLVTAHWFLSWALGLTVLGHLLFALKHHFLDKDSALRSMMPGRSA
ncbi:cytochrome b [Pleomorphomonas sp. NRK KF1]|uniref:cytochrome b n=1 Tax=Pleomorphomonas sp. NRK KF1 TaxID=2943000 RepID=UPI002043ABDA|nr:cytochrome b [Pleomorphomonas sp. NRK KF1]MCM5555221.1 cytochrome b [Pleomorphomonas sp. NRK KF1]